MMNFVALCLVLTSLVTSGVWSPAPEIKNHKLGGDQEVMVKDGHRVVVVVEYDQEGHPNTKVSISPDHDVSDTKGSVPTAAMDGLGSATEKFKEASSGLPNPKELICDAYGKCKHKISSAMGKTKEVVSEKAHEDIAKKKETAQEAVAKKKEIAREVGEAVEEAYDTAKEAVKHSARDVGEAVEGAYGRAKETVTHRAHDVGEAVGKAKETVSHQAQKMEDRAKESAEKAKETMKSAKDIGKTMGVDVAKNVTALLEATGEEAAERAKEAKHGAEKLGRESKRGLRRIFEGEHFRFGSLLMEGPPKALNPLVGVMNLLGLAAAFGMCLWITFIHSHVLAGALPRQQFGVVQSKIYPVYFRAMAWSIGFTLLAYLLSHRKSVFTRRVHMFHRCSLLASLLMVLTNLMYLEPRATKVTRPPYMLVCYSSC